MRAVSVHATWIHALSAVLLPGADHRRALGAFVAERGILRELDAGETLISDRFTASTLAYQGYGRGLDLDVLRATMSFATHDIEPDVTVLLDVDLEVARARLGDQMDRIEGAGAEFHQRVRNGYLELAAADPERWLVIDAGGTVDEVAARIDTRIDHWFSTR